MNSSSASLTPPRLLVVLPAAEVGGAETLTREMLLGLSGFRVTLLTQRAIADIFQDIVDDVVLFDDFGLENPYGYAPGNLDKGCKILTKVARSSGADAVYAVMHQATIFLALARRLHPRVFRCRGVIGSIHGSIAGHCRHRGHPLSWYERALMRLVFGSLDALVVPSQGVAREMTEVFRAPARRVHAIHNGFDLDTIRRRAVEELPLRKDRPWVMTACRLGGKMDPWTLLEGFAAIDADPLPELIIVGEGELRPRIEEQVAGLNLTGRVRLVGFQENPFKWMARADVFVLSSHYEGFGNVLVEAMALGVPVVASDCPSGPSEIVEAGVSGELFVPGDGMALARHLTRLLGDDACRERMARKARERAGLFSRERMIADYERLFASVLLDP